MFTIGGRAPGEVINNGVGGVDDVNGDVEKDGGSCALQHL